MLETIVLENDDENISLTIENPENIQLFHVQNMREHLKGTISHPSTGNSAMHTSWVMDKILCKI